MEEKKKQGMTKTDSSHWYSGRGGDIWSMEQIVQTAPSGMQRVVKACRSALLNTFNTFSLNHVIPQQVSQGLGVIQCPAFRRVGARVYIALYMSDGRCQGVFGA